LAKLAQIYKISCCLPVTGFTTGRVPAFPRGRRTAGVSIREPRTGKKIFFKNFKNKKWRIGVTKLKAKTIERSIDFLWLLSCCKLKSERIAHTIFLIIWENERFLRRWELRGKINHKQKNIWEFNRLSFLQCLGSILFWCGSGSESILDPHWNKMDPNPGPGHFFEIYWIFSKK